MNQAEIATTIREIIHSGNARMMSVADITNDIADMTAAEIDKARDEGWDTGYAYAMEKTPGAACDGPCCA